MLQKVNLLPRYSLFFPPHQQSTSDSSFQITRPVIRDTDQCRAYDLLASLVSIHSPAQGILHVSPIDRKLDGRTGRKILTSLPTNLGTVRSAASLMDDSFLSTLVSRTITTSWLSFDMLRDFRVLKTGCDPFGSPEDYLTS